MSAFHMFIFRSLVLTCHICPFRLVYVVQLCPDNLVLTFPISSVHLVFGFHAVSCEIRLAVSYLSCQPGDDVSSGFCPPRVPFADLSCAHRMHLSMKTFGFFRVVWWGSDAMNHLDSLRSTR